MAALQPTGRQRFSFRPVLMVAYYAAKLGIVLEDTYVLNPGLLSGVQSLYASCGGQVMSPSALPRDW